MAVRINSLEIILFVTILIKIVYCENEEEINMNFDAKEYLPLLFNLSYIKETTHNYDYFRVYLKEMPNKGGLGVFASRPILANRTLMYYKSHVFNASTYIPYSLGMYTFYILEKDNFSIVEGLVADIYEGSLDKPRGRIPYWGYLANEPDESQTPNAHAHMIVAENYREKDIIQVGDLLTFKLVSCRDIAAGEEITWCYGETYRRSYKVNCGY